MEKFCLFLVVVATICGVGNAHIGDEIMASGSFVIASIWCATIFIIDTIKEYK